MNYNEFLQTKSQGGINHGFKPIWMPDFLFDFQKCLFEWGLIKGRAALFEDCGLGKTVQALVWAENIIKKENCNVLILTPIAVGHQFISEGEKFGIECHRCSDGVVRRGINITNYEKLHLFDPNNFGGIVCDESSILKHFTGSTQMHVTRFMLKIPYRLLCSATPAPNDFIELGTSSEALGELGYSDMLSRFFVQDDSKAFRMNEVKLSRAAHNPNHFARLSYRIAQTINQWRMKAHAEEAFWRFVASWARVCKKPNDLGFPDGDFILPALTENQHIIKPSRPADGMLFQLPAFGLKEEREERKRTLNERCEYIARLVDHGKPAFVGCHLNSEGDLLEKMIHDGIQVSGSDSEEEKEEKFLAFINGQTRVLITKPKIGAWGLNFQHCAHVVSFVSHSYEQQYQFVRRCWRFGQKNPVTVDLIATEGESRVMENVVRKEKAASIMFDRMMEHMNNALGIIPRVGNNEVKLPSWIKEKANDREPVNHG